MRSRGEDFTLRWSNLWTVLLSVDFSGKFLYVTNYGSNNVSAFTIDPASGALSPRDSFPTGSNPASISTTGTIQ